LICRRLRAFLSNAFSFFHDEAAAYAAPSFFTKFFLDSIDTSVICSLSSAILLINGPMNQNKMTFVGGF